MTVQIDVFNFDHRAQRKSLYQNSIEISNDIACDFRRLYDALKLLYPKASFITFNCSTK